MLVKVPLQADERLRSISSNAESSGEGNDKMEAGTEGGREK